MPANELKPCPFCGNTAPQLMTPDRIPLGGFMVCCPQPGCQAQCRLSGNRDKAIAAWNRRAGDSATEVERG
ncbi:Lar family restriction alleviation protein [Serratia marcescens]|nr:Lar family restriction alleviation protein [Serratia marcescens]MBN3916308.1 Lar family restriction alleviation protein [Serratia marcescens]MBN3921337.1 Lar family restriction alleviation protein [Serratia marcescens]MBN3938052.1 Lar family restriction alleviation protein [Serratia marcescens]MBN3957040.1 Lar family restriction alleviation protein [Serratia marcescens]